LAGDWIKMKITLTREPEVRGIAKATGLDPFAVVGRLHAIWAYADETTEDGAIPFTDEADIDAMLDHDGFAAAMMAVGWLEIKGGTAVIPRFGEHNGKSAKKRAANAKRNARWRESTDSKATKRSRDAGRVTSASPREEKRREESVVVAREPVSIPAPGGQSEWTGATVYAEVPNLIVHTVGWNRCEPKDTEEVVNTCAKIVAGDYPEIPDQARGDPLGWLTPRLRRVWIDRKAERDAGLTRNPPSLLKTLREGKWRIDPDETTANVTTDKPKPITPERQRALDRMRREAK